MKVFELLDVLPQNQDIMIFADDETSMLFAGTVEEFADDEYAEILSNLRILEVKSEMLNNNTMTGITITVKF